MTPSAAMGEKALTDDPALDIAGAMRTDSGRVRPGNEDHVAWSLRRNGAGGMEGAVAVVCDGMGGHAAGEVASEIAAQVVVRSFWTRRGTTAERLLACIHDAHAAIRAAVIENGSLRGMGTTCTALVWMDGRAYLAHVGDSRAYLLRGGVLRQISDDQTYVARLVRDGVIRPEEASTHPEAHVILQALGSGASVAPSFDPEGIALQPGDRFILCTDGLTNMVADARIRDVCLEHDVETACELLIAAANHAGGPDNISVGVFAVTSVRPNGGQGATRRLPAFRAPSDTPQEAANAYVGSPP